ncbi:MAG: hypothetical protein J0I12_18190 [Candidatus Eremiobacteraeota bacterium]|nr:hypothetical protein [Candidatus Eremiobacteraeota bacterium]
MRIRETIPQSWSGHSQSGLRYRGKEAPADSFILSEPQQFPQLKGQAQVSGHLLSDPQHLDYPSSRYEIRCYAPGPQGEVRSLSFEELVAAQERPFQPEFTFTVQGDAGRARRPDEKVGMVLPKDHSLQVDSVDMQYQSWGANRQYFQQMSEIGRVEQFQVRGLLSEQALPYAEKYLKEGGYTNYQLHPSEQTGRWLEDYSEPLLDGGRVVPAHFPSQGKPLSEVLKEARQARFQPHGLSGDFTNQGSVNSGDYQQVGAIQGKIHGETVYQAGSYIEGGNLLSGHRADGTPYVLVGQDSMALTKELLARQLGRTPEEQEVRQAVAADYGVQADQIFGIEQPGEFHLDMRMSPLGPGVMALQDSRLAAQMQAAWIREELGETMTPEWNQEVDAMVEKAEEAARYEELARRDLEKAGFQVVPVAGAFRNMNDTKVDGANFFNARHGTNPDGEKYTIMMGGTAKQEAYLADFLLGQGHLPVERLYFLDPEQNQETLPENGGLKCRTKPTGQLA